jgi:hypothetical protein
MYHYTGKLPKGIAKKPDDKYTGNQLRYIGAALFSDLNGAPTDVVAEYIGADYVADGRRKKRRSPSKKRRSPSKKRRFRSKKRRSPSKKRRSPSKRRRS